MNSQAKPLFQAIHICRMLDLSSVLGKCLTSAMPAGTKPDAAGHLPGVTVLSDVSPCAGLEKCLSPGGCLGHDSAEAHAFSRGFCRVAFYPPFSGLYLSKCVYDKLVSASGMF